MGEAACEICHKEGSRMCLRNGGPSMSCSNFMCGQPLGSDTTFVSCSSYNRDCQRCLMCYVFKDLTEPAQVEGWAAGKEGAERIKDFADLRSKMEQKLLSDHNSETLHNGDWNMWILDELKQMEQGNAPGAAERDVQ